jgi:hypothetical protein
VKKRIILAFLILVLLYSVGGVFYNVYYKEDDSKKKVNNIDSIKGYTYTLPATATNIQKDEFKILKKNLESKKVNEEDYAKSISKLFIIELYTINNKVNKYDVGGTTYIYPDSVENYKTNVEDTIYKYVEDNSDGKRTQKLPEVSKVTINSLITTKYKINNTEYDAYKLSLNWTYIEDLKYDTKGEIILIKIDKFLYIVEKN